MYFFLSHRGYLQLIILVHIWFRVSFGNILLCFQTRRQFSSSVFCPRESRWSISQWGVWDMLWRGLSVLQVWEVYLLLALNDLDLVSQKHIQFHTYAKSQWKWRGTWFVSEQCLLRHWGELPKIWQKQKSVSQTRGMVKISVTKNWKAAELQYWKCKTRYCSSLFHTGTQSNDALACWSFSEYNVFNLM